MRSWKDGDLKELLGEARAIHFAMTHGQLSYQEAKSKTSPLLQKINAAVVVIAKKHNKKPKLIQFSDLGSKF